MAAHLAAQGRTEPFILALMSEWPVLYIRGTPPAFGNGRRQALRALHVERMVPPGTRESTSWANSIIWRSG